jgi:hypothetical protein
VGDLSPAQFTQNKFNSSLNVAANNLFLFILEENIIALFQSKKIKTC